VRFEGAASQLGERQFRLLWLGRISSAAGDALVPVALSFAVLSVNGSAAALGSVLAVTTLSRVLFTLVGGVVADRFPRRAVMIACDGVRAGVQALVAALLLAHHMTLPLFFVTGAIFGAASAFFGPASDGLVPQTVSARNLQPANALLTLSRNVLNVFGPALSGALIAAAGTGWVYAIDSASFVASGIFLVQLRVPPHERPERSHFVSELREGFREVLGRPWVRWPIAAFAISNFCLAAFIVLGPPTFTAHFDGARDWGIVSACGAVGAIAGAVLAARLRPMHPLTACFLVSTLLAVPIATLAAAPHPAERVRTRPLVRRPRVVRVHAARLRRLPAARALARVPGHPAHRRERRRAVEPVGRVLARRSGDPGRAARARVEA
jgi:MFS family permease